jgi:hypothetical protein
MKELGDRLPDISEGTAPTQIHRPHSGPQHEKRDYLARVIGRRGRRVVTVIGGKDNEVLLPHPLKYLRQRTIQLLQPSVEPRDIVSVTPRLIELDDVGQEQSATEGLQRAVNEPIGLTVVSGVYARDPACREQVIDLPYSAPRYSSNGQLIKQGETRRSQAEVPPSGGPSPCPRFTGEWSGDYPRDGMLALQHLASQLTGSIELG